jgi:hypothetical protein
LQIFVLNSSRSHLFFNGCLHPGRYGFVPKSGAMNTPPTLKLALLKYAAAATGTTTSIRSKTSRAFAMKTCAPISTNEYATVEPGSAEILFNYPIVYATGHGNMLFSDLEAKNYARLPRRRAAS